MYARRPRATPHPRPRDALRCISANKNARYRGHRSARQESIGNSPLNTPDGKMGEVNSGCTEHAGSGLLHTNPPPFVGIIDAISVYHRKTRPVNDPSHAKPGRFYSSTFSTTIR